MTPPKKTSTIGISTSKKPPIPTISTPMPLGAVRDKHGIIKTKIGNINIIILPDSISAKLKLGGETTAKPNNSNISHKYLDGIITSFTPPAPLTVTIQTVYKKKVKPTNPSAYGRGTTLDDINNSNISLQFHEGSHGSSYLSFFTNNPPPEFSAKIGMTEKDFILVRDKYLNELKEYFDEVQIRQWREVDCVGTPSSDVLNKVDGTTCSTLSTPNPKYK